MIISLSQYELFSNLNSEEQEIISNSIKIQHFKQEEIIHFESDTCESIELIIKGHIRAEQVDDNGNVLVVREFKQGSYIGTNILYSSNNLYMLHIIATEDTVLYKIPKRIIDKLILNHDFCLKFIRIISDNSIHFGQHIKLSYRQTLRQKILRFLNEQRNIQKSNKIVLKMSKTNLAMLFGVERTSLSRELKKMKDQEIIDYDRTSIIILDYFNF